MSNPRIPRKPGQPANSKKHSDLYTDENPKGTIHGLGFKDVATAKASVSKIRNSSRSHAHKIQAAVAMEQRAREMGKTSEAAVYRKFINMMKKKTKEMNEEVKKCPPGQYYCFTDKSARKSPWDTMWVGEVCWNQTNLIPKRMVRRTEMVTAMEMEMVMATVEMVMVVPTEEAWENL